MSLKIPVLYMVNIVYVMLYFSASDMEVQQRRGPIHSCPDTHFYQLRVTMMTAFSIVTPPRVLSCTLYFTYPVLLILSLIIKSPLQQDANIHTFDLLSLNRSYRVI